MNNFDAVKFKRLAVAVSGGSDSLALCLLLEAWRVAKNCADGESLQLIALIVDHNLRENSAEEALGVQKVLQSANITSVILRNNLKKPSSALQNYARDVRYNLLQKWCEDNSFCDLFVAHNFGDCLETTAIRLESGSTQFGLAGISPLVYKKFGRIIRPLLNFKKAQLIEVVKHHKLSSVCDPSNFDMKFSRARVRKELQTATFYNDILSINQTSLKFRKQIESNLTANLVVHTRVSKFYYLVLKNSAFDLNNEDLFYLIRPCLYWVGGRKTPVRSIKITNLMCAFKKHFSRKAQTKTGEKSLSYTLGGCKIKILNNKTYIFTEQYIYRTFEYKKNINFSPTAHKFKLNPSYLLKSAHIKNYSTVAVSILGIFGAKLLREKMKISKTGTSPRTFDGSKSLYCSNFSARIPRQVLYCIPAIWVYAQGDFCQSLNEENLKASQLIGLDDWEDYVKNGLICHTQRLFCPPPF